MKGPTHSAVALHGWVLIFGEASRGRHACAVGYRGNDCCMGMLKYSIPCIVVRLEDGRMHGF